MILVHCNISYAILINFSCGTLSAFPFKSIVIMPTNNYGKNSSLGSLGFRYDKAPYTI